MGVIVVGPSVEQMGRSIADWVKAATIDTAMSALTTEVRRGFDNEPEVITDGVLRRDPNQVKPFGKIEFVARTTIADAVLWALDELRKKSPVLTGRYAASHIVMVNGAEVQGNIRVALMKVKSGDHVQIVNPQPYARKIESATASRKTGRQKRRALSRKAPGGVYRPVLRALLQRYSKSIFVDFKYVKLNSGVKVWGLQGGGRNRKKVQRDQVFPALQFFTRSSQTVN